MENLMILAGGFLAALFMDQPKAKAETTPQVGVNTGGTLRPDGNVFTGKILGSDHEDPAAIATAGLIDSLSETFDQSTKMVERNPVDNFRGNQQSRYSPTNQDMESTVNKDSLLAQMAPIRDAWLKTPTPKNCPSGQQLVQPNCLVPPCDPVCMPIGGWEIGGPRTPSGRPDLNWDANNRGDRINQLMRDQGLSFTQAQANQDKAISAGADLNADGFVTNREWFDFSNP